MSAHRAVPVSQAFWWPSEVTEWRCTACRGRWDTFPSSGCRGRGDES